MLDEVMSVPVYAKRIYNITYTCDTREEGYKSTHHACASDTMPGLPDQSEWSLEIGSRQKLRRSQPSNSVDLFDLEDVNHSVRQDCSADL